MAEILQAILAALLGAETPKPEIQNQSVAQGMVGPQFQGVVSMNNGGDGFNLRQVQEVRGFTGGAVRWAFWGALIIGIAIGAGLVMLGPSIRGA